MNLLREYGSIDTTKLRGMEMYKNFKEEDDFHQELICLSSAALLQQGFNVENLVCHIGGTHVGAHHNLDKIRQDLTLSVDPALLDRIIEILSMDRLVV